MRVLVADDNLAVREYLSGLLAKNNHFVLEANSESHVLKVCRDKCPDLLFIDIKVDGKSGLELVNKIRHLGGSAMWNTIVLMADHATAEELQQGLDVGADDFLNKPITESQLLYKLATATRHQDLKSDVFEMAHDLVLASHALESFSKKDEMTGIYDVNTFYKILETEWFKAKKEQYNISLILLNIDYFRAYNEIYGADVGDQTIKKIAVTMQKILPGQYATIARTAGETFAVLLPNKNADFCLQVANNLVQAIADLKIAHKGSACSDIITISAGVAVIKGAFKQNYVNLLEAADFALYKAKHNGRNRAYLELVKEIEDDPTIHGGVII